MADGRVVRCFEEVSLDLELVTIAGPVATRSVTCVILPGEGDEFLLGSDALKSLGIIVQDQLDQLVGASLLEVEEDEFPVGYGLSEAEEQVRVAPDFGQLVANVVVNGLPTPHVAAVQAILGIPARMLTQVTLT
ncbi:hypothetical protein P3T76_014635 [Phytophthora citrophthora]|uniref:Uncharacterized protein n=1 Tax=Phytophthora citrophthora TaxID=4793 RepID=A0AAD9G0J9_9STRA|nr:hypothetical protein P3T76_014635 [Phytophthora citrophthora]